MEWCFCYAMVYWNSSRNGIPCAISSFSPLSKLCASFVGGLAEARERAMGHHRGRSLVTCGPSQTTGTDHHRSTFVAGQRVCCCNTSAAVAFYSEQRRMLSFASASAAQLHNVASVGANVSANGALKSTAEKTVNPVQRSQRTITATYFIPAWLDIWWIRWSLQMVRFDRSRFYDAWLRRAFSCLWETTGCAVAFKAEVYSSVAADI